MILGAIIILVALFSGFPPEWNTVAYVILGVLTITAAYLMQPVRVGVKPQSPYMDHSPMEVAPVAHMVVTPSEMPVNPPSPDLSSTEIKQ